MGPKSFGRRKNPTGRDGQIMRCSFPDCGSDEHFIAECPKRIAAEGRAPASSFHFTA